MSFALLGRREGGGKEETIKVLTPDPLIFSGPVQIRKQIRGGSSTSTSTSTATQCDSVGCAYR